MEQEAHDPDEGAVDEDPAQHGAGGEGEPRVQEEDQPGQMGSQESPGSEARSQDVEPGGASPAGAAGGLGIRFAAPAVLSVRR